MSDQPQRPAPPVEIDVCSGPSLSRAERLALASQPRQTPQPRGGNPIASSPRAEAAE